MKKKVTSLATSSAAGFSLSEQEYKSLVSAATKQFRRKGAPAADAEEFVHQALEELLKNGRLSGIKFAELKRMVLTRATWRWQDVIRREGREFFPDTVEGIDEEDIMDHLAWSGPDRERQLEDEPESFYEFKELFEAKLKLLNDQEKFVINRIVDGGVTREKVAQELGVKSNTVDQIWSRALKKLRDDAQNTDFHCRF